MSGNGIILPLLRGGSPHTYPTGKRGGHSLPQAHANEDDIVQLGPLSFPRCEEPLEVVFLLWAGFVGDFQEDFAEALSALHLGF